MRTMRVSLHVDKTGVDSNSNKNDSAPNEGSS